MTNPFSLTFIIYELKFLSYFLVKKIFAKNLVSGLDFLKIRKSFPKDFDPNTKIHKVKTDYKRIDNRREIQKALDEMEEDNLE